MSDRYTAAMVERRFKRAAELGQIPEPHRFELEISRPGDGVWIRLNRDGHLVFIANGGREAWKCLDAFLQGVAFVKSLKPETVQ